MQAALQVMVAYQRRQSIVFWGSSPWSNFLFFGRGGREPSSPTSSSSFCRKFLLRQGLEVLPVWIDSVVLATGSEVPLLVPGDNWYWVAARKPARSWRSMLLRIGYVVFWWFNDSTSSKESDIENMSESNESSRDSLVGEGWKSVDIFESCDSKSEVFEISVQKVAGSLFRTEWTDPKLDNVWELSSLWYSETVEKLPIFRGAVRFREGISKPSAGSFSAKARDWVVSVSVKQCFASVFARR